MPCPTTSFKTSPACAPSASLMPMTMCPLLYGIGHHATYSNRREQERKRAKDAELAISAVS